MNSAQALQTAQGQSVWVLFCHLVSFDKFIFSASEGVVLSIVVAVVTASLQSLVSPDLCPGLLL